MPESRCVKLVFEDQPPNTHLKYDVLFSAVGLGFIRVSRAAPVRRQQLWNVTDYTYVVMQPGFELADWDRIDKEFFATNMAEMAKSLNATWRSYLQPLAAIHLDCRRAAPTAPGGVVTAIAGRVRGEEPLTSIPIGRLEVFTADRDRVLESR